MLGAGLVFSLLRPGLFTVWPASNVWVSRSWWRGGNLTAGTGLGAQSWYLSQLHVAFCPEWGISIVGKQIRGLSAGAPKGILCRRFHWDG